MKIILAQSPGAAVNYGRLKNIGGPRTVLATSPAGLEGLQPTEIHVASGAMECRDFWDILDIVLAAEQKQPILATWFWDGKLIPRDVALHRLGVDRRPCVGADQADKDAAAARRLLETVKENTPVSQAAILVGAAQAYATLSTRGSR